MTWLRGESVHASDLAGYGHLYLDADKLALRSFAHPVLRAVSLDSVNELLYWALYELGALYELA